MCVCVCLRVFELVCESTSVSRVLVFTWQPTRKGSDAGGSGGARAADIIVLQRERVSEKKVRRGRDRKTTDRWEWDRNKETNELITLLVIAVDGRIVTPLLLPDPQINKHAVKMSQCPRRLGKCTFDYEMCLPSAQYKSSDTGFCLFRASPVPVQSQPPWLLFTVTSSSLWPAALPDWAH